jgi:integrase
MKPATTVYDLATLRRAFNLAHEAGRVVSVPRFPRIKFNNTRKGFIEQSDYEVILRNLPPEIQPILTTAWWTGWRTRRELLSRRVADVDLRACTLQLDAEHSKNGEARTFHFAEMPELRQTLEGVIADTREYERATSRITPSLFHREGRPIRDFRKAWIKACQAAGKPGLYIHDLRRSSVRNMTRAGIPEKIAMTLSGHKTRNIFDRYDIVNDADQREAGRKLAAYLGHNRSQSAPAEPENSQRSASLSRARVIRHYARWTHKPERHSGEMIAADALTA